VTLPNERSCRAGYRSGLNTTGYAIIERRVGGWCSRSGMIVAPTVRWAAGWLMHEGVAEVIAAFQPAALAIEELYSHYERPQTAILMGHARGVICLAAAQADLPIHSYAATQIKRMLTGNGRAPKTQVQQAILREFGLREMPEPPDVADAMAIALCHHYLARQTLSTL
jgi:crossover junction endodeoxyribonuclease RuvC